jgi:hypothetical protein
VQAVTHLRRALGATGNPEARSMLDELEPALRAQVLDVPALEAAADEQAAMTSLVLTANVLGATASIDRAPAEKAPIVIAIAPGKHTLVVRAPGHHTVRRVVQVIEGSLLPVRVELVPEPAKLALDAPTGAAVHVDGELVGTAPFEAPVPLDPGRRFVAVTLDGHEPFGQTVQLQAGRSTDLAVDLETTGQRIAAWMLIGGGLAAVGTGIGLGVVSVIEHRKSRDILDEADGQPLDTQQTADYDDAVAARDDFRLGSGIAGAAGLALLVVGGVLFAFDAPVLPSAGASARGLTVRF